jgi:hypothetical protein
MYVLLAAATALNSPCRTTSAMRDSLTASGTVYTVPSLTYPRPLCLSHGRLPPQTQWGTGNAAAYQQAVHMCEGGLHGVGATGHLEPPLVKECVQPRAGLHHDALGCYPV